jgi:hypothetical protein
VIVEIRLDTDTPEVELLEPDVFTAFKVVLRDAGPSLAGAPVVARVDEHAWIRIEALRELAGESATPAWEESLAGMVAYARSKGWVDDELGAVRAHVERGTV